MAMDYKDNVAYKAGKRFLPKVANASFYYDGVLAFVAKANTDSQVNIQTTQDQIRAGQNNVVIGAVTSEKTIDISFSTPEWKPEFLAANIGETIQIGDWSFEVSDTTYTVTDGKITLAEMPSDGVIYVDVNGTYVKVEVPETLEVDVSAYGVTDKCISVFGMFDKKGKRINLSTDTDPLVGKLILDSPIFEGTKGKVGTSQYVFPAFALSGNWDQTYGADATHEISGTAIATDSEVCGEGQSYGYYQEYVDTDTLDSFSMIFAAPSVVELAVGETETIKVYGSMGVLYNKTELTSDVTFATEATEFTVGTATGLVTAVSAGAGTITVTYGNLTTTVSVEVTE